MNYKKTISALYIGYVTQAIVNNFLPLLFVYFNTQYGIPTYLITFIITYNFALQIFVDYLSSKIILKWGYRKTILIADSACALGLIFLALVPFIFSGSIGIYIGIMIALSTMAFGGGVMEVILSPVMDAISKENKSGAMSLLHSFYCIGHMFVILIATGFFAAFSIKLWQIVSVILALVPIIDLILFSTCPIKAPEGDEAPVKSRKLFSTPLFILVFIIMFAAGAGEQAIAQWISYFAEEGLNISKTIGDLIGTLLFAACMFISRATHKFVTKKVDHINSQIIDGLLLTIGYLITYFSPNKTISLISLGLCGLFIANAWPGIYATASSLFTNGGTVMFSFLALAGDLGCTLGPSVVGLVSSSSTINFGLLVATIFPIILLVGNIIIKYRKNKEPIILC